jgi:hypothetical protein
MAGVSRFAAVLLLLLTFSATGAHAAPFYERPADPSQSLLGSQSYGIEQQTVDNFSLPTDQVLGHIAWSGGLVGSQRETQTSRPFVVRLFTSSGAGPAPTPFYEYSGTATAHSSGVLSTTPGWNPPFTIVKYDLYLPSQLKLSANTTYWLSILNAQQGAPPGVQWCWYAASFVPGESVFLRDGDAGAWHSLADESDRNSMSFALSVPEPTALLAAPALFLMLSRRRQRATSEGV